MVVGISLDTVIGALHPRPYEKEQMRRVFAGIKVDG